MSDIDEKIKNTRAHPITCTCPKCELEAFGSSSDDTTSDKNQMQKQEENEDEENEENEDEEQEEQEENEGQEEQEENEEQKEQEDEENEEKKEEEKLMVNELEPEEITLQLGDIIVIQSPLDYILHKKIFYIDYIDKKKIRIINVDDFSTNNILINDDGTIADENINSITIISSNPNKGYARQNGLLPNTWIDIYFKGDIPMIITGLITNLEDDMIEIKTIDNEILYINFNYQGIPENLPSMSFEIREKPTSMKEKTEREQESKIDTTIAPSKIKSNQIILNNNDFVIGELMQIEEIINVDDTMLRYNIEEQTNSLFENLLSSIPNNKRNSTIINEFNTIVKRFSELRQMSSIFDKYNNVEGPIIHRADDIPLADYLSEFRNKLYWIKYGVINNRDIYVGEGRTIMDVMSIKNILKKYSENNGDIEQNNYHKLYNSLNPYLTPFRPIDKSEYPNVFSKPEGLIISKQINGDTYTVDNTMSDTMSQVYKDKIITKKFIMQQYNTGLDWLYVSKLSKGGKLVGKREKMTPNEIINVNSIFTLPEPVVRFSQINLPNSNLLVKANLNHSFINYFQLLNKTTSTKNVVLNDLENIPEIISSPDNYLNDEIKKFTLNLTSFDQTDEYSNETIFHQFIKLIIPRTTELFNLISKYINGTLSPQNAILYLEPFMIYSNNLTFTQYKTIAEFVKNKIYEYNNTFAKYQEIFDIIKRNSGQNVFTSKLYNLLNDLTPEPIKSKKKKESDWVEYFSEKYQRPYWSNKYTKEAVWENPDKFEQEIEEPEIQIGFFNEDMKTKVIEMYKLGDMSMSSSEFIKKILSQDYGNLFSSLIGYTNLKLMFSSKLNKLLEGEKELLKQIIESDRAKNTCKTYVIAKKYYSYDKLIKDNDKDIYFDKEYDETNYDIIDEKFKMEQSSMTKEQFREFLIPQLKKIYKISDDNAIYLAETLTNGMKKVLNGHYGLLSILKDGIQTMSYYLRQDNMWVEADEDLNLSSFIKDDDVLCNINYDCLYENAEKKCLSNDINADNTLERQFKGILDQFDKNYELSMDELKTIVKNQILFNEKKFTVLNIYNNNEFLKYNNNAYKLGKLLNKDEIIDVVSPYANLRDLILGQNDYAKKQQNIIVFVDKYCRNAIPSSINPVTKDVETERWLYCRETNVPLIPQFRYELAKVFVEAPENYNDTIEKLIKEIGKQSDNGDSWVDKYSGEVICKIEFDISEGYKDGFVNKSREIIEADTDEIVAENLTNKQLVLSFKPNTNTIYINDIITVLEGALGVQLKQHKEFILKFGTSLLRPKSSDSSGMLLTRAEYEEKAKKLKGKKIPSYELYYSIEIMYLTLGLFAIGLQITIPSIKTRKIAPRCTKSFQGYPLGDRSDDSFIRYISCAMERYKSDTIPWMAIDKEDKMTELIIRSIDDVLLPNVEIKQKILSKIEYLSTIESKHIPDEYNVAKWTEFLPPLRKFHIRSENKSPVDDNFLEDLEKNISNSNPKQQIQINVINSKIIYQSLAIQEEIQKIIDKKELIMKSSSAYHMINSCCNNITDNITALEYFINEAPYIENYNNYVKKMSNYLTYINYLSKAPIYISNVNTKSIFPEIPNVFSEENIYRGFITYCKFNTLGGLSKELLDICIEKPTYVGKGRSIQEQIFQLKKMGREYTIDDFLNLYKVVSKNNLIKINFDKEDSPIEEITNYVNKIKNKRLNVLSKNILEEYSLILDPENFYQLYENDTDEMKTLKNSLEIENDKLSEDLIKFLKSNKATNSKKILTSTEIFIRNLRFTKWEFNMTSRNNTNNISNDKLFNYNKYISNFIELFSITLPEVIINKKKHTMIVHKYWKLSASHQRMAIDSVEQYYSSLNKFYNDLSLAHLLSYISSDSACGRIVKLSKLTPSMANIAKDVILKHSIDEEISSLLYEYYLLCVFKTYISLSDVEYNYVDRFGNSQVSDILTNRKNVAELFIAYIGFMIDSKYKVNVSYESVFDDVFKNREFEKNLVTDRLANMTQEERDIDTTLKGLKLGMYSIGQSKALRFYDQDQFEEDKKLNEAIEKLEKKSKKQIVDDVELEDGQMEADADANEAEELMMNTNEDYEDGDPYADEYDEYE